MYTSFFSSLCNKTLFMSNYFNFQLYIKAREGSNLIEVIFATREKVSR